jgi:hypothetical protein
MERRQLDFHDFDSVAADIDRLHKNGYTKVGQWELCQACDHLSNVMRMSMEGFPFKAPWYIHLLAPLLVKGRMFKTRRMREGFQAPSAVMPSGGGDEKTSVNKCKDLLKRVRDYPGEFEPNPFFGKLTADEWRQHHLIHSAHHLSFLIPKG